MSEVLQLFRSLWDIFEEVQVPLLNISFAQLYLGAFVASISIVILRPLLGIGAIAANNLAKGVSSSRRRRPASSSNYIMPVDPSKQKHYTQLQLPAHKR